MFHPLYLFWFEYELMEVAREEKRAEEATEGIFREELNKEHKKALSNFRDQVRYKDYRGLIKTLSILEPVILAPEKYLVPERYAGKHKMVHENILLLKNIVISDIKHSVGSEKGLEKSIFMLSTILFEKFGADVQVSVVTWMCNTAIARHREELEGFEKLSDVGVALERLLAIREQIGVKTAHLPIWWNVSKVVLCSLSVIVKNKLMKITEYRKYTEKEFLAALQICIDFEKTHLGKKHTERVSERIDKRSEAKDRAGLGLPEDAPSHLKLLADISTERPDYTEEMGPNPLSAAFFNNIDIYVKKEISFLIGKTLVFHQEAVHQSVYSVYSQLAQTLSNLTYFRFPNAGAVLLRCADQVVSQAIRKSPFSHADSNFISGIESVFYMRETTRQMVQRVESLFGIAETDCPEIFSALEDLENRIYASFGYAMQKRVEFLNRNSIAEERLSASLKSLLDKLGLEIEALSKLVFSPQDEVLCEWLEILGQSLFYALSELKPLPETAAQLLCFMSSLEVPLLNAILTKKIYKEAPTHILERTKIYLKLFVVSPGNSKEFVENFQKISNGLFDFHQILVKVSKRHRGSLIEAFNISSGERESSITVRPENTDKC